MKKVMFILATALLTGNVFSQTNKNQFSFSIGPSFAVGDFADKSLTNEKAGSAETGANLNLYYGHKFTDNLGLGIKWFGNSNKLATEPTINEMNNLSGYQWTTNTSYWSAGGLLVGLTVHAPCSDKFIVDFRLLGGYVALKSPEMILSISNMTDAWLKMESASAGSFGYNIGAGCSYFFSSKWNLLLNLDYIGANFKFDEVDVTFSTGINESKYDEKQFLGVVNATIGIGYNF